jgi:hypothetical protein
MADIAMLAVVYVMIRVSAYIGGLVDRRSNSRALAWACGIATAAAIFSASLPTITALTGVQCNGDADYSACMDGD